MAIEAPDLYEDVRDQDDRLRHVEIDVAVMKADVAATKDTAERTEGKIDQVLELLQGHGDRLTVLEAANTAATEARKWKLGVLSGVLVGAVLLALKFLAG